MGRFGGYGRFRRLARVLGLGAASLALAHCSGNVGRIDPKYGVKSSARVVARGQPVPKGGGVYRVGRPYTVAGRTYVPAVDNDYNATGLASWYGGDFHGRYTANGEIFDMNSLSAAHPTLPLPSYVRVTNLANHRSIVVRVNDRGPYVGNRVIDVSVKTAKLLGFYGHGLAKVKVEYVGRAPLAGSDDRKLAATLRQGVPGASPVQVASAAPAESGRPSVQVASANGSFAPTFFDARPMTRIPASQVPAPPARPYAADHRAGNSQHGVVARALPPAHRVPTTELAAARSQPATSAPPQVSAYAPVRYDGHAAGFNGRGLY